MGVIEFFVKKWLMTWERADGERLAGQRPPEGIREIADIPYIDDGLKEHLFDIYYPEKAEGKLPVIIDIHGGGLVYGGKHLKRIYDHHLSKEGFIVFNVDYRLAFEGVTLYDQIKDTATALKYISGIMAEYPADKDRVFITGDSAGAFLAALMALISKSARLREIYGVEDPEIDIKAAGLVSGMLWFDKKSLPYWGHRLMCLPKRYKKTEAYKNVIFKDLPEMKDFPPAYLVTSDEDVLRGMTFNFEKALEAAGVRYKFTYLKKEKGDYYGHVHSVMYPENERGRRVNKEMLDFFRESISGTSETE